MTASSPDKNSEAPETLLMSRIASFRADPAGYVLYAFPWGEPGPLKDFDGPDAWQRDVLNELGRGALSADAAVRLAVASGHGIGKTALIAWIVLWFMSTRAHPQIVATSNTKPQLDTKTWRELAKWRKLAVNGNWFEWTSSKFYHKDHPETWFAAAIPWSRERSEAFAGTHEKDVLVVFDEASLIDDAIWEVTEGAMTQPGAFWVVFGNPTRSTGRFAACFGRFRHRWSVRQIDSRTARMAGKKQIAQWIEDYGEDSDFCRVRVRGLFPRAAASQLIPQDLIEAAVRRVLKPADVAAAPRLLGVDVARFGDDQSVILRRQGLAVTGLKKFRGLDTMTLAGLVAREIDEWRADAVFIDAVGIGAGVVDRLVQLGYAVIPVNSGSRAHEDGRYANLRAEMWDRVRQWLENGGCLPDDRELLDDLIGPEYGFDDRGRVQLEKKSDMKKRGIASPDSADALALTFARNVAARGVRTHRQAVTDFNPFGEA